MALESIHFHKAMTKFLQTYRQSSEYVDRVVALMGETRPYTSVAEVPEWLEEQKTWFKGEIRFVFEEELKLLYNKIPVGWKRVAITAELHSRYQELKQWEGSSKYYEKLVELGLSAPLPPF